MKFNPTALSSLMLAAASTSSQFVSAGHVRRTQSAISICRPGCAEDSDCESGLVCYTMDSSAALAKDDGLASLTVPGCDILDFGSNTWCVDPDEVTSGGGSDPEPPTEPEGGDSIFDMTCNEDGTSRFPDFGEDSAQRMLLREGVIDAIPANICNATATPERKDKNVILVVGDGMGWEMIRAGAIARQVLNELEELGCDTKVGCPDNEEAMDAFMGRSLADYYTEGYGSGLSFQNLPGKTLVTTGAPVLQEAEAGNHYSPNKSLLKGDTSEHNDRQAELYMNACGFPWEFNPKDISEGGNMALWDDVKGGEFPWDPNYYTDTPDTSSGFDPEFIMQHATDSAPTASAFATGKKMAGGMMSQNLYERDVETILEEAIKCGKAAGVVSSVPMFHATPGAFIIHTNNRGNRDQLRTSWINSNPTLVLGMCGGQYYPYEETLQSMVDGSLSSSWTFLVQNNNTLAEDFYNDIEDLDPDNGDHLLVCLGGDFTPSGEQNMPYRGVDSTFSNRHCSSGEEIVDPDTGLTIGVDITTPEELCNHYEPEEIQHIPTIQQNVEAALNFLSKDDEGFFLMYEQGDIDWSAHANHMDDMLGTMLDIDDSVQLILDWIEENGGWEKNALYVTADHDHYLTLNDHFPEALAKLLIAGESHKMTPFSNTDQNTWDNAIKGGRHEDDSKSQTEHLADYATWTMEEQDLVAHFWGPLGSGGNGWGSHSARPVPLFYDGDDGCVEALIGAPYRVVGKEVAGSPGKIDQVHIHACMTKALFGL